MMKKILISVITAAIIALGGWVGKSIIDAMGDIKVASNNITTCIKSLDKLADRYEEMDDNYADLKNELIELRVRLEVSKLESMEASLTVVEYLEIHKKNTTVIPSTGGPKNRPLPKINSTSGGSFNDLKRKVLEQRKLVETLERP